MAERGTLRDQQAEFTRQLLMEAARSVLLNDSSEDFTIQKVAKRAGVSHRTVYRYFPTRQALIDEYSNWLEESNRQDPRSIEKSDSFADLVRVVFARFDSYSEDYEAAARVSGGVLRPANQVERDQRTRAVFDRRFPDLEPGSADLAYAIIRSLVGLQTWFTMRDRFGMKDGQAGEAVAWAVGALEEALKSGNAPSAIGKADGHSPDGTSGDGDHNN